MTLITRRNLVVGGVAGMGAAALGMTLIPPAKRVEAQGLTVEGVLYDPVNPVLGNPEGDVTIVEFFDYQCPYCKANHPVLTEVVEEDGNIRLMMKDWPIFGAASVRASQLALGAADAGVYAAASDALMGTAGRLTDAGIDEALQEASLDPARLDSAYRDNRNKWDGLLMRNSAQAEQLGLQGTPAFIVGTTIYPGSMDRAALREAVANSRS
ncbi:DsbA family protein [Roseovarius sp. S4756]|uniref:DsbA family protein n=1 Tax=Roseovarius maritimus TaxID=3342637 RepID=UPI00372A0A91